MLAHHSCEGFGRSETMIQIKVGGSGTGRPWGKILLATSLSPGITEVESVISARLICTHGFLTKLIAKWRNGPIATTIKSVLARPLL